MHRGRRALAAIGSLLLAICALLSTPFQGQSAEPPKWIQMENLQLSTGAAAGTFTLRFRLLNGLGGKVVWSEDNSVKVVKITQGGVIVPKIVKVVLGKKNPLRGVDFSQQLWLQVSTLGGPSLAPSFMVDSRHVVAGVMPYALWSEHADYATHAANADTATVATSAGSATTCTNWVGVSCPDGQCLKGFTAAGAPTCVPCGSSSPGGTAQQWSSAAGGNNHWYEAVHVPAGINWSDARAAAESRGGYLATVSFGANSAAENSFIFSLVTDIKSWHDTGETYWGPWLDGNRNQISDEWEWVTGEAWSFTNWGSWFSPGLFERGLQLHSDDAYSISAEWNDLTETSLTMGYIVEWNARPWWGLDTPHAALHK